MRRRASRRHLGLALMVAALVGALTAGGPAMAQDAAEVDAPVRAKALITYPANDVIPDTLLTQFPPQVVCVVFPDACPESLEPVREPIGDQLKDVDANDQTSPLQPANPDGLTVTYFGGNPRYASAVQVELPDVPDGEQVDEFVLTFPQGQPSFSFDSPLFRRIVNAIIQTAGSQDPEVFQEQLGKALEEEPSTQPLLGIEACPLTVPVPEDAEPPQSVPVAEISEENVDGELVPAVDCLFGSNGAFDADAGTWSFDLTTAARAWADGTLEDHGVLLRPTGAPNLAFGDPDTSTNAQVVLDVAEAPKATFASSEPPPPPAPFEPAPPATDPSTSSGSTGSSPSMVSNPPSSGMFSSSPDQSGTAPSTSPPAEVAPPEADAGASQGDQTTALDATPATSPTTPWTVWLLVVPFAGGAWLLARSLTTEVAVSSSRPGALTRLVNASPSVR